MDDRVGLEAREHGAQRFLVRHVRLMERGALARDFLDLIHDRGLGIAQIIHNGDRVPRLKQLHAGVAADVARTAGNKNLHF